MNATLSHYLYINFILHKNKRLRHPRLRMLRDNLNHKAKEVTQRLLFFAFFDHIICNTFDHRAAYRGFLHTGELQLLI